MDYATMDRRAAKAAQKRKAKTAPPKCRAAAPAPQPPQGRSRSAAGQATISPCGAAANGFLKLRFLPHLMGQQVADEEREAIFYSSFSLLCAHYNISPSETRFLGYPYNKAVALWEAKGLLREKSESIEIIDSDKGSLQAAETYNTGSTLYYIPVAPLYRLLKDRRTKRAARLLLCTCAYLYHVTGIPYYTDDSSYICWQYDMIRQWVEDDREGCEDDSFERNRSQLNAADHIGAVMQRRLWNPCHLNRFSEWVEQFVPIDEFGCACLAIAEKALLLWQDYPQGIIYRHADLSVIADEEDDYNSEGCITMDKYIGFCAETEGWLYHTLSECVNSEFNECTEIQQPVLTRIFDGQVQNADSLDFDCRLYSLINDLCFTLNSNDNENAK